MTVLATDIDWGTGDDAYERRVQATVEAERARREARRRVDAEERPPLTLPVMDTLRTRLARPVQAQRWRIEDVFPRDSRAILSAQFKAGKTTLVGNLVRALTDGDSFLDRYPVYPVDGTVVLLDFEMGHHQLDAWLRAQRITRDDQLIVVPLRGGASTFNLLDADTLTLWAHRLREVGCRTLVIDCLGPLANALGLDEHSEMGKLLVAIDTLAATAGVTEVIVVHHMGHNGERSRGDSRLRDWPDVEWRLVRKDQDPASPRFLTCYGRDVDIPESQLLYDATTRRLSLEGGSRQDATCRDTLDAIQAVLAESGEPMSGRGIKAALTDSEHSRDAIDAALAYGVRKGQLHAEIGARRAKLYRSVSECPPVSGQCPANTPNECPAPIYRPDSRTLISEHRVSGGTDGKPFVFDPTRAYTKAEPRGVSDDLGTPSQETAGQKESGACNVAGAGA